jgi:hypothetical protein
MSDTVVMTEVRPAPVELTTSQTEGTDAAAAADWEVEEVLARFDKVGRDTRAGGTTSCH